MSDDIDEKEKMLDLIERSSPETVEAIIEQAHQIHNIPRDKLLQEVVERAHAQVNVAGWECLH